MSFSSDFGWDASPAVLERSQSRTVLEAVRLILAEEGIPSVVEVAKDARGGWCLKVSMAAESEASQVLQNRKAMGALVDWENLDVGEVPREVEAILEGREGIRRFSYILWVVGLSVGLTAVGLAVLGIVLAVLG